MSKSKCKKVWEKKFRHLPYEAFAAGWKAAHDEQQRGRVRGPNRPPNPPCWMWKR